jgi:basic membrane lipoprotein Med (substrate-binding protein (PBP1-ABC) superfamily)
VVTEIINSRAKGVYGGKHIELSLANGGLQLIFNDAIIGDVPKGVKQVVLDAKAKIIDGSLKVKIK